MLTGFVFEFKFIKTLWIKNDCKVKSKNKSE